MSDQLVGYREANRAAFITLDSPQNRNALSNQLLNQLREQLDRALLSDPIRTVVLGHTGGTFCSGADLREQAEERSRTGSSSGAGALAPILELLLDSPKPVVAAISGAVRGGGMGLVAASDLAVAGRSATFAFSEVRVGVAPAVIAMPVLAKMGRAAALELFLTGRTFGAEEAQAAGLVNRVAADPELNSTVAELLHQLMQGAPGAQGEVKRLLLEVPRLERTRAFAEMSELSQRLFSSPEALEGIAAFRSRRPPDWAG
ncbi:MAG: enoyl-CoA hydratase-related protein [Candidatus Dormiibacterota bacterium]